MLGLIIWLIVGGALGLLHARLPGLRPRWWTALLLGTGCAIAGGLVATAFGFGGLAVFDARSMIVAALAAVVGLNAQRALLATTG